MHREGNRIPIAISPRGPINRDRIPLHKASKRSPLSRDRGLLHKNSRRMPMHRVVSRIRIGQSLKGPINRDRMRLSGTSNQGPDQRESMNLDFQRKYWESRLQYPNWYIRLENELRQLFFPVVHN